MYLLCLEGVSSQKENKKKEHIVKRHKNKKKEKRNEKFMLN